MKLTKSVNKTDETENVNQNTSSITLSQKIQKETPENVVIQPNNMLSHSIPTEKVKITSSTSAEEISNWLLSFIGESVFEQLKNNPYLQLPYSEPSNTLKEWLEKALKTIFTLDQIKIIGEQIIQNQNTSGQAESANQKAISEKAALEERLNKADLRFAQMQNELEDAEAEKFKIKKEIQSSISLSKLINEFFMEDGVEPEETKKITSLLRESLENKDENLSVFVTRFSKGWFYVKATMDQLRGEEKEKMEQMHNALTFLLTSISGVYLPERRPLLDAVAKLVSSKFTEYDFVSPEQTLQIDPQIHNAGGLGNAMIKEGTTFAVVRRQTRQAVKYADIKVVK